MSNNLFTEASNLFVKIDSAPSVEEAATHVEEIWKLSESLGAPFKLFVPFLVQRNFPAQIFDRIVANLLKTDQEIASKNASPDPETAAVIYDAKAGKAHLLLHSVCNFLIAMVHDRVAGDNNQDIFNAVLNIARGPSAFATAIETGCFLLPFSASEKQAKKVTAIEISKHTLLGAILNVSMFKHGTISQMKFAQYVKWYPFNPKEYTYDDRMRDSSDIEIHQALKNHSDSLKSVIEACLRSNGDNREKTFRFIAKVLEANRDHKKSQINPDALFDRFSMVALSLAMIQLAQPILGQREFYPAGLKAVYLQDHTNPNAIVRYHKNDDKIIPGDDAPKLPEDLHAGSTSASASPTVSSPDAALPSSPSASASAHHVYAPKYHIFYLAVRAFDLAIGSLTDHLANESRYMSYAAHSNERQSAVIAAEVGFMTALLSSHDSASLFLRFTDAAAEWLLFVSGADRVTGEVESVSPFWAHLPQSIIDTVFQTLTYLVVEMRELLRDPPLVRSGYYEFTHCVSLALLLMGNERLLPKPFTHLQYPEFVYYLMRVHGGNFRNHPWFVSHALADCIECYIIIDNQEQDKINQRNILGGIMKDLLNDPHAVNSVRSKFNATSDRRLERLTKMMTSDANFCLDLVIKGLQEMHEKEEAANNTIPVGDKEYDKSRRGVKDGVILSKTILTVFTRLLDQFKEGMAQHLVVQQVGAMLVTFLVRLAGPESAKLKSLSAADVGFNPRELVELIVEAFIRFHDVPGFCRYCVEGTGNMEHYFNAVDRIRRLNVISGRLLYGLNDMEKQMKIAEEESKLDSTLYSDPPDWAQCQVMYDLLEDPVELPNSGEEPIVCNREAIRHQLLDHPMNPFNRQPLTVEQLDAHNETPDVKQKLTELKQKIEDWKAERRQAALKEKSQDAAQ